jgi:hypothetical protein
MQIIIFRRLNCQTELRAEQSKDEFYKIQTAYNLAERLYPRMTGFTFALSLTNTVELAWNINVKPKDNILDVGVGSPCLVYALSAAADGGVAIGSDLR